MGKLTEIQGRALAVLADILPPWTLTGGGALVGFHLGHRTTRDLDLFWHGKSQISDVRRDVISKLEGSGFEVEVIEAVESFVRLSADDNGERVLIDLVAEPVLTIDAPVEVTIDGKTIFVDTPYEILVNKLCALLHRSELRDLMDIRALVESGLDLDQALNDAPKKDGGFSGVAVGWALSGWAVDEVARSIGLEEEAASLIQFRDKLLRHVAGPKP